MNKIQLRIVIVMMSLALAGIIVLQGYWIRHDLQIKSEQFDQEVMLAMGEVVELAEQNENMRLVIRNFVSDSDSLITSSILTDSLLKVMRTLAYAPAMLQATPAIGKEGLSIDSALIKKIADYQSRNIRASEGQSMIIDSSIDIRIEKDIQQKEVYDFRIRDSYMDSLSYSEQRKVDSKLKKLNSIMQKLTFQIVDPNTSIFERIPQPALDSLLKSRLALRQVDIPYEYGIYNALRKDWYYRSKAADTTVLQQSSYRYSLFPNDIFKSNQMLVLAFRNRVNYLISRIWPMLLSSMLLTAIIIFGFGYTIRTINRQKKLAMIKNDFINNMTHEFKTPIATIALANQSLRDPRVHSHDDKLQYFTGVIHDENQRMLRQVENVLQMAQLDKGELRLRNESLDVNEIIEASIASMRLTVEERGGSIQFERDQDEALLYGDANHLMNVFINVLDNANKYSPEKPEIHVKASRNGNMLHIAIRDHGIGMSREVQKRIFETFYRAGTGNRHDVKGFGLGLSYVKAIIEQHQGSISVSSEPAKGSTFTIILPISEKKINA